jgi:hypothetical protein
LILFSLSACTKRAFIDNDYSYQGLFTEYSSFNFMDCPAQLDSMVQCSDLQESIRRQMVSRGFKQVADPDLLVTYTIFRNDLRFKGFQQPQIEQWVNVQNEDQATYKSMTYRLNEGTLLVSLIDTKTYGVIWQGYASKLINDPNVKKNYYKNIIRSIFDQYPLMSASRVTRSDY